MKKLIYKNENPYDATAPKQIEKVWIEWGYDCEANTTDYPVYFCRAIAEVSYSISRGSRRLQQLQSSGIYGVDTYDGDYALEIEDKQLAELAEHLEALCGITGMPSSDLCHVFAGGK